MRRTSSLLVGLAIQAVILSVASAIVAKTFAIRKPEPMSLWVALPLHAFFLCCYPLNWVLNRASRSILRLFNVAEASHIEVFSGQELRGLIGASRQYGVMRKLESDMLRAVLDLDDVEVGVISTHRKDMLTIDADTPVADVVSLRSRRSRSRATRSGAASPTPSSASCTPRICWPRFVPARKRAATCGSTSRRRPWFVPDTTSLAAQLLAFRHRRAHLAVVVDEYGALQGLVTLEDIIEEIVGDISDEKDIEVSGVKPQPDGSVLVEGRVDPARPEPAVRLAHARRGRLDGGRAGHQRGPPDPRGRPELRLPWLPLRGAAPTAPSDHTAENSAGALHGRLSRRRKSTDCRLNQSKIDA